MLRRKRQIAVINFAALVNSQDPTRTITLRNQFIADATRRFRELMRDITTTIVDNDALGLKEPVMRTLAPAPAGAFAFARDDRKIAGFMAWLRDQEAAGVLEITATPFAPGGEPWSNLYVRSSYQRGLQEARRNLIAANVPLLPFGTELGQASLLQVFNSPFHANRVALLYTRAFNELQGITEAMNQQISRVLAQGVVEGQGIQEIARRINDRVDKIGISRSRTLARTEVVRAFNEAVIGEHQQAEAVIGEPIFDRWFTALDERVRSSHRVRHNRIFEHEQALALIGEPNCRCTLIPFIQSVDGERTERDVRAANAIVAEKRRAA